MCSETCEWCSLQKKLEVRLGYFKGLASSSEQEAGAFKRNLKERIIHEWWRRHHCWLTFFLVTQVYGYYPITDQLTSVPADQLHFNMLLFFRPSRLIYWPNSVLILQMIPEDFPYCQQKIHVLWHSLPMQWIDVWLVVTSWFKPPHAVFFFFYYIFENLQITDSQTPNQVVWDLHTLFFHLQFRGDIKYYFADFVRKGGEGTPKSVTPSSCP